MTREALKLTEAIAAGLLVIPFCWLARAAFIAFENPVTGLGDTGVPWRWVGLGVAVLLCLLIAVFPREHKRVTLTIGLAGAGLAFGIGFNGPQWYLGPGEFWDIRVLWLYMTDSLATTHARYDTWLSIAWLSAAGLLLAFASALTAVSYLELPLRELRRARQHGATNRYRSKETVFGDANWANWREIRDTVGDPRGIVLGEDYDPRRNPKTYNPRDRTTWGEGGKAELVTMSPDFAGGHSLVFAGTGSGKTVGIVYPTALTYRHPIIFMDPQHEIYETVAAARTEMGFQARVIEVGHGIDLINLLRPWLDQSGIAYMHLADSLVGRQDALKSEYSQFYASEGANIVSGLLEYSVSKRNTNIFKALYKFLAMPEEAFKKSIENIVKDKAANESIKQRLASYAEMDSRNFSNLQANIKQALNWASFPELCDILDSEPANAPPLLDQTTDVYIRIGINDLKSFPGIVRAILAAIVYHVNESRDGIERLMIVDEAYQVGRLQGFELIRDTMRKRGLHLMLIFQSIAQIEQTYQKTGARAWNNSVAARVYAGTDDLEDQGAISRMIGEYTVDVENRSTSTGMRGFGIGTPNDNKTKSINRQRANLMRPEQVRELQEDALLVFFKGQKPMICGKAFSFRRKEWQEITPFRKPETESGYERKNRGFRHLSQVFRRKDAASVGSGATANTTQVSAGQTGGAGGAGGATSPAPSTPAPEAGQPNTSGSPGSTPSGQNAPQGKGPKPALSQRATPHKPQTHKCKPKAGRKAPAHEKPPEPKPPMKPQNKETDPMSNENQQQPTTDAGDATGAKDKSRSTPRVDLFTNDVDEDMSPASADGASGEDRSEPPDGKIADPTP